MEYRRPGQSQLKLPAISFGAGPVSGLMVGSDTNTQQATVQAAIDNGINWFDTAATYGSGDSEQALGRALQSCRTPESPAISTKVRLTSDQLDDIAGAVRSSLSASLQRLGVERVTLLQLHNSVTARRDDLPTSVCVRDVLDPGGVVDAFEQLKQDGLVDALGFTGLGDQQSLRELTTSGVFTSAQVPVSLLTPFAAPGQSDGSVDVDYLQLIEECRQHDIGVLAIRVFAGGALADRTASAHTHRTKFFTLDIFERDRAHAARLASALPAGTNLPEASVRYVLSVPGVTSALLGFATPQEVQQAATYTSRGPLDAAVMEQLRDVGRTFHV